MNGFVVRIALRQHVPLRAGVEYPQYSFEHTAGRDRLASRTSIGDVLFRKMIPDAFPLLVCEPNHPTFIADRLRLAILRWVLDIIGVAAGRQQFGQHSLPRFVGAWSAAE